MQKSRLMKPKLNIHTSWKTQAMNISLLIIFASSWIWQQGLQKASLMITKLLCFFLVHLSPMFSSLFMSAMVLFGGGPFTGMKTKWLSKLPPFILIIFHCHVLHNCKFLKPYLERINSFHFYKWLINIQKNLDRISKYQGGFMSHVS